jgi:uncharacterized protein (DUF169 family)
MELKQVVEALNFYIRPQTFPLALKMGQEGDIPERARRPVKDMGLAIPVCQGVGMARRYGWIIAMGREDNICPYGGLALGFFPPKEGFLDGTYLGASESKEAAIETAKVLRMLEYGKYSHLIISPLHMANFEPHLILLYGNSAQILRLVQGRLFSTGGALTSQISGGFDCSDIIPGTMLSDECQVILPCNGDRIFGSAQDQEMAFTIPWSKVEMTLQGLEAGHKSGLQRYPIPSYLRFQPQFPPSYVQLFDYLKG